MAGRIILLGLALLLCAGAISSSIQAKKQKEEEKKGECPLWPMQQKSPRNDFRPRTFLIQ